MDHNRSGLQTCIDTLSRQFISPLAIFLDGTEDRWKLHDLSDKLFSDLFYHDRGDMIYWVDLVYSLSRS